MCTIKVMSLVLRIKGLYLLVVALWRYFKSSIKYLSTWERPGLYSHDEARSVQTRMEKGLHRYEFLAISKLECRASTLFICGREPSEADYQQWEEKRREFKKL